MIDCLDEGVIYIFDCADKGYMIARIISKTVNSPMPYLIVEEPCRLLFKDANKPDGELIQLSTWVPYMLSPSKTTPVAMRSIQSVFVPDEVVLTKYLSMAGCLSRDRLQLLHKNVMARRTEAACAMSDNIFRAMDNIKLREQ